MRIELRPAYSMDSHLGSFDIVAVGPKGSDRIANFRPMDQTLATEIHSAFVRWADRVTDEEERRITDEIKVARA